MAKKRLIIDISGNDQLSGPVRRSIASVLRMGAAARSASSVAVGAFRGLIRVATSVQGILLAVGAALIAGRVVRGIVHYADAWQNATNRLAAFIPQAELARSVQEELFKVAQRTRTEFEGIANTFSRLLVSRDLTGASIEELLKFTESVGKAVVLSGSTTGEAAGALRQLSQLLANRDVRAAGQELQSIREQAPFLFRAILDGMQLTEREFRDLAEQGKLTSKEIIDGLNRVADQVDERFARVAPTVAQSLTVLSNSTLRFFGLLSKATGATEAISSRIIALSGVIDDAAVIMANFNKELSVLEFVDLEEVIKLPDGSRATRTIARMVETVKTAGIAAIQTVVFELRHRVGPAIVEIAANGALVLISSVLRAAARVLPEFVLIARDVAVVFVDAIIDAFRRRAPALATSLGIGDAITGELTGVRARIDAALASIQTSGLERIAGAGGRINESFRIVQQTFAAIRQEMGLAGVLIEELINKTDEAKDKYVAFDQAIRGAREGFVELINAGRNAAQQAKDLVVGIGSAITDNVATALVDAASGAKRWATAFREAASGILKEIANIIARLAIARVLAAAIGIGGAAVGSNFIGGLNPSIPIESPPSINTGGFITAAGVRRFDAGGMVRGPNVNRDIIPALLTPGEGVLNRRAMAVLGENRLHALNRGEAPAPIYVQPIVHLHFDGSPTPENARLAGRIAVQEIVVELDRNPAAREAMRRRLT
jgi:tape measure domain-containing protein